jgi:hypothetical protein
MNWTNITLNQTKNKPKSHNATTTTTTNNIVTKTLKSSNKNKQRIKKRNIKIRHEQKEKWWMSLPRK